LAHERLRIWKQSAQEHLWMRIVLLTVAIALAATVAIPFAIARSGQVGALAVLLAAAVCLLPGVVVLAVQGKCRHPQLMLLHVLVGFVGRLLIPLAACMVVYLRGGPLAEAGFAVYLLGLYFVALAVGTLLDLTQHESKGLRSIESTH
jgi:hypothetical protein